MLSGQLPEGEWDTVGGLLFSTLGKVAAEGDDGRGRRVPRCGAEKVQGRRIDRVGHASASDQRRPSE